MEKRHAWRGLQLIIHEFVSGETWLKVKICCKYMIIHISIESIDVVFFVCFDAAFAFGAVWPLST